MGDLTMLVCTKVATGCVKQDGESVRAENASIHIVYCIHRSMLQLNTSSRVIFSALLVKALSNNR